MIKIFIESGVNAAQKKGSKRTTNEQNFVETLVAHYFPHAVLGTDYLVVGVNGKDQLPNTQPVFVDNTLQGGTNLVLFDAEWAPSSAHLKDETSEFETYCRSNKKMTAMKKTKVKGSILYKKQKH